MTISNQNTPVWAETPALHLPPLAGDLTADVCVVGLGGSGLSAIQELLKRKVRVVGIDAGMVAGGAAGRNGGFLLAGGAEFHHDAVKRWGREQAVQIYHQTLEELDRMMADPLSTARRTGSLRIATAPEEIEDCREQLEAMRADDLPVEWYRGPEGEGLRIPTDGTFQPLTRCHNMAERAVAIGALLFQHAPAIALSQGVVTTPQGSVRVSATIVAVDGNLEVILPELEGRVRTARLQMLATEPTNEVKISCPVYARYGFEYWQQLPNGQVVLGGLRDKFGHAEWTGDAVPTPALQTELEEVLRNVVGVRHAAVTHRWAGAVGFTPDYLPIAEMVRPGVIAIGGYCGTGNLIGAIKGREMAKKIVDG